MARRPAGLDADARRALVEVLAAPTFELIPLKNAREQAALLPSGSTVSVTASPAKGIEATVELARELQADGFRAVPHLSARMIRDRAHLRDVLDAVAAAGISRAFVVGGDAEHPGDFSDGLSLLRAMAEAGHGLAEIGIPCYPEGHAVIPNDRLLRALADKQPYASYMTTQMCFDPRAIGTWLGERRREGITLPVHIGLPGVAEVQKLIAISARIGIGDSRRFLSKNFRLLGRLVRPGGFSPDGLLEGLATLIADPEADIRDLHVYTFNQVESTEAWRVVFLAALTGASQPATA